MKLLSWFHTLWGRLLLRTTGVVVGILEELLHEAKAVRRMLAYVFWRSPGRLKAQQLNKLGKGVTAMLVYKAVLPAKPADLAADVTKQRFYPPRNGSPVDLDLSATESPEFTAAEGEEVTIALTYVDDAVPPNESSKSTLTFTAHDTIPPSAPDLMGATLLREEPDAAPTPEPEPEPAPTPGE